MARKFDKERQFMTTLHPDHLLAAQVEYIQHWYKTHLKVKPDRRAVFRRAVEELCYLLSTVENPDNVDHERPFIQKPEELANVKRAMKVEGTPWRGPKLPEELTELDKERHGMGEPPMAWWEMVEAWYELHPTPRKTLAELLAGPNRSPFKGNH